MSPDDQDFDWVEARHKCSVAVEFERFKTKVREATEQREGLLLRSSESHFSFKEMDPKTFRTVYNNGDGEVKSVDFILDLPSQRISVKGSNFQGHMTLVLGDDGECKYLLDGKGPFKRWQVLRQVLEHFFFNSLPPSMQRKETYNL